MNKYRHPVVAISHGPGPLWMLKDGVHGQNRDCDATQNVGSILSKLYGASRPLPKCIIYVSAHWESESSGFEISQSQSPEMIYDCYGLPNECYGIEYPAKGDPAFACRVSDALTHRKIPAKLVERGYDHGVFTPMMLIRPEADIPIVSVSINDHLSAKDHFELGKALASFRDEDALIICSGQATHNLRAGFNPNDPVANWANEFQSWLDATFSTTSTLSYSERQATIENWQSAPSAKKAHPTPDHFTPFVVAMGAGMEPERPAATKLFGGWTFCQLSLATYAWGVDN